MLLDVFTQDAFSMVNLTAAMNKLPHQPSKLGDMGLFKLTPITTDKATIEEENGKLVLVQSAPRGSRVSNMPHSKRKVRIFQVPHLPLYDGVKADEVLGIREMGNEQALRTVASLLNNRLQTMKNSIDVTKEYQRCGAIQGQVLDADGSVIYNYFDEFGVTQETFTFYLGTTVTEHPKVTCQRISRQMMFTLGAQPFTSIQAIVGDSFWDAFIISTYVVQAYINWDSNVLQRQQRNGFMWGDIYWMNYTGKVNNTYMIPVANAFFVPVGAGDTMQEICAPADFIETVNTPGQAYYAKQKVLDYNKGVEVHAQANPLMMVTRPASIFKGTYTQA